MNQQGFRAQIERMCLKGLAPALALGGFALAGCASAQEAVDGMAPAVSPAAGAPGSYRLFLPAYGYTVCFADLSE